MSNHDECKPGNGFSRGRVEIMLDAILYSLFKWCGPLVGAGLAILLALDVSHPAAKVRQRNGDLVAFSVFCALLGMFMAFAAVSDDESATRWKWVKAVVVGIVGMSVYLWGRFSFHS